VVACKLMQQYMQAYQTITNKPCPHINAELLPVSTAVTHKLNVSGHVPIWAFFLDLVCGTRAKNLVHLSVTSCM
jgi:hypothetical protein